MDTKIWYRVDIGKAGAILRCTPVESAEVETRFTRYIEASSVEEATSIARDWYVRDRSHKREWAAKVRAEALAQGLCPVCRDKKPEPGRKQCKGCSAKKCEATRRALANPNPRHCLDPLTAMRNKRELNQWYTSQKVTYQRVLEQFDRLGPVRFRKWLLGNITESPVSRARKAAA